ncbi:hypothetical protein BP5796_09987 [Coleophoma crateriformis]|uniref:Uncharacterized protein n=1 Tax=Coleophoma crateriformis TaxID=565419 RepID=A0A3D8QU40_9HELO|nr:hypothetical protein BP5796_09987 [Coleophoma crateriformis]
MEPQWSPMMIKHALIQGFQYQQSSLQLLPSQPVDFMNTYWNFFSMDADKLDCSRTFMGAVTDIDPARKQAMREAEWSQRIKLLLQAPGVQVEVERLMDEDIKERRPDLEKSGKLKQMNFVTKASLLAVCRMEQNVVRFDQPQDYKENHRNYEFTIFLMTLINGDGATKRQTTIRLSNRTRFQDFLTTMRDATSMCTMPEDYQPSPWMIDFADSPSTQPSDPLSSSQSSGTLPFSTSSSISSHTLSIHNPDSSAASSTETPAREIKGFTLEDGPWLYHIITVQDPEVQPEHEIVDEYTYRMMVGAMRDAKTDTRVLMIHSKERERQRLYKEDVRLEMEDQARRRELFRGLDPFGDGDEEDVGESNWMRRRRSP